MIERIYTKKIVALLVMGTLIVSACGGGTSTSDNTDATDTTDSLDTTGGDGSLDEFNKMVDDLIADASAPQVGLPPTEGPPIKKDVKLFVVPCAMVAQGCADSALAVEEAAKAVGWDVTFIDPAGDPTKMNDAVTLAISQGADAFIATAIDGPTLAGSLSRAREAGLVAACFACYDPEGAFDYTEPVQERNFDHGYLAMATLYIRTGRSLKVVMANGPEYGISAQENGREFGARKFIEECKAALGDCELVAETEMLTANFGTSVPGQVVSVLRANPNANALWGFADPVLALVIPSIQQAGIEIEIAGVDPVGFNFDLIRAGKLQRSSVAQPLSWIGYSLIDQVNRILSGQEMVPQNIKGKLITIDNVPANGAWNGDSDVRPLYLKLWGIKD